MNVSSALNEHDHILEIINEQDDMVACIDVICSELNVDFVTYHLAFNEGKAIDTPYIKTNYPADWVRQYLINNYLDVDPVAKIGFSRALPSFWHELDWTSPEAISFREDAAAHGVGESGYTIPLTDKKRRRAMVNFASKRAPEDFEKMIQSKPDLFPECAEILHRKALFDIYGEEDERPSLSPREIQCLYWVAQGKDAGSIAIILDISEHTVRDYCKSAKHKLGCATLFQAIHKATMQRLLDSE